MTDGDLTQAVNMEGSSIVQTGFTFKDILKQAQMLMSFQKNNSGFYVFPENSGISFLMIAIRLNCANHLILFHIFFSFLKLHHQIHLDKNPLPFSIRDKRCIALKFLFDNRMVSVIEQA